MNIFVPFTKLCAETFLAVPTAQFVPLTDEYAYSRYFQERWRVGETFINVEHDVVPTFGLLESLWICPAPLCLTHFPGGIVSWLACVKISSQFMKDFPIPWGLQRWQICDSTLWTAYGGDDKPVCVHGEVGHLHYYPQ